MDYSTNISFFTGRIIHSVIQLRKQREDFCQLVGIIGGKYEFHILNFQILRAKLLFFMQISKLFALDLVYSIFFLYFCSRYRVVCFIFNCI